MTAYPHLFSPFKLGRHHLPNRIVHASTSTHYAQGGLVTDRLIDYYVNRAWGGASLLVSEPMSMLSSHQLPTRPAVLSGINRDALKRWAHAVEAAGGRMMGQVQDNGRGQRAGFRNPTARGASALPDDLSGTVPRAMSTDEIRTMIDEFAQSCRALAEAGFAGAEISAGHGHLFHQFLARRSNNRQDVYGGDRDGRTRLLRELMAAIRASSGRDFVIGLKLPAEDYCEDGIDLVEAEAITRILAATGEMDYLTYCWGSHSHSLYRHLPDNHGPRVPYVETINRLGRAAAPDVPLGARGLITDPNEAERIVAGGTAELVMLARPLVTDPAWGAKARAGREAEIRYCVSCNTCWHTITTGRGLKCDNNPRVGAGDEADWDSQLMASPRRVVVVGAGIAGMEAAWVAAARGHDVTLFGASDEPGGKTRIHAGLPGGEGYSSIYDFQALAAQRSGVKFRLGRRVAAEEVLSLAPDHVVIATGSQLCWPSFLPAQWREERLVPDIREAVRLLAAYPTRGSGTAAIWDDDGTMFVYDAAQFLLARFEHVCILTSRERLAGEESLVNRQGVYARLLGAGVTVLTSARPCPDPALEEGEIAWEGVFGKTRGTVRDVAFLTYATPRVPDDALAARIAAAGVSVDVIGDASAPRTVLAATEEGYRAAIAIGAQQ